MKGWTFMNHSADGAQAPPSQERPTAELVRQLSEQVSVLVRDELKLAQLEMTRKAKQAGAGAGMLGGGRLVVEVDAEQSLPRLRRACPREGAFGPASGILPACQLAITDLVHVALP
jgi:hypothetical protein